MINVVFIIQNIFRGNWNISMHYRHVNFTWGCMKCTQQKTSWLYSSKMLPKIGMDAVSRNLRDKFCFADIKNKWGGVQKLPKYMINSSAAAGLIYIKQFSNVSYLSKRRPKIILGRSNADGVLSNLMKGDIWTLLAVHFVQICQ